MNKRHKIERIGLLTFGGTIDKIPFVGKAKPGQPDMIVGPPVAPAYLRAKVVERKLMVHIWHHEVMRIDSLYMTDEHRSEAVRECHFMKPDRIIATHGSDTVHQTAAAMHSAGLHMDHTIVFAVALRAACMKVTDTWDNLDLAFDGVRGMPPGIYIAMGELFPWDECEKSESGKFVRIPRRRRRL